VTLSTAGIRLVGDKISQDEWECSVIQNAFGKGNAQGKTGDDGHERR